VGLNNNDFGWGKDSKKKQEQIERELRGEEEKPNYIRFGFIADPDQIELIKRIAYWRRVNIKDVMAEAIGRYIAEDTDKEELKPIPERG
jgi:hypothetical protein